MRANTTSLVHIGLVFCTALLAVHVARVPAGAAELRVGDLITEALAANPEVRAARSGAAAVRHRISRDKSLPDPMLMIGYQDEGFERINYGNSEDAQIMVSASQMFPFPGKLPLRGEMTLKEAESAEASVSAEELRTVRRVRELYLDLFLAYELMDLLREKEALLSRIEEAALVRYSSGMGSQREVIMVQKEKYMLAEREEMLRQKQEAVEAMLGAVAGRNSDEPFGRPAEPAPSGFGYSLDELYSRALENSPDLIAMDRMQDAAAVKIDMAKREYYPDITLTASVAARGGGMDEMWSVTSSFNVPVFYKAKQREGVREAEATLESARFRRQAAELMVRSGIRENFSMVEAAGGLIVLYRDGLIPKARQDFEAALAAFMSGKSEAMAVISSLISVVEFESLFRTQFVEREKAIARIEALAGMRWNEK